MSHHAKAASAGSTQASGNSRGLFRRALATRGALGRSKGTGAPSSRRGPIALIAALATIAGLALTAAPALAAPPTVGTPIVSDVSYTTAHVTSAVDPVDGFGTYQFQVSTDGTNWAPNTGGFLNNKETLNADLTGLEDGTQYFVRLIAADFFVSDPPEVISPGPNPSFTTLTADPPTIPGAVSASGVFSTSATGSAEVNRPANSNDVKCQFEYVSDEDFGATGFDGAIVRACEPNPIAAAGTANVSAKLGCTNPVLEEPENCLQPSTAYRLRVVVENAAGQVTKDAATTFTTAPPVAKPSVLATGAATEIGKRSAQVTGEVERPSGEDPALDVNCRFEFVTEAQFGATGFAGAGQAPCAQTPIGSPEPGNPAVKAEVSAELGGLEPGTTYHFRLAAENGGGIDTEEAAATFTTLAVVHPTFTVDSITEVGYTGFRVTGTADAGNQGAYPGFEFSPADTEEWVGTPPSQIDQLPAGSPAEQFSLRFPCFEYHTGTICYEPLKPGTTYKVRFAGRDQEEFTYHYSPEPYPEFTTLGTSDPPIASCGPVTAVTGTSAHFSCSVDANAPDEALPPDAKDAYRTDWRIECVPECKDANGNTIAGTVEAEEGAKAISADAKRLEPDTHYEEVKLIATNVLATVETPAQAFDTLKVPPTVKQTPGAPDGKGGYTLQGVVNPNNQTITACRFQWGPDAPAYAFSADCSPLPNPGAKPTTVEAHLTGLNPGVDYHALLVVEYGAGLKADSGADQKFKATLAEAEPCPANEQIRAENNSLALPECRAYEMVSPPGKEGFGATLRTYDGGDRVLYISDAGNIAKSGQGELFSNSYVAARSTAGWETIPNLNGPSGSLSDAPTNISRNLAEPPRYSSDLLSSVWYFLRDGVTTDNYYLRGPNGLFTFIGEGGSLLGQIGGTSDDLSHLLVTGHWSTPPLWGPGVYEFLGTGNEQPPRRVDVDNSGSPIGACGFEAAGSATSEFNSRDGRVALVRVAGGCGGANPPASELWARIDGTTSIDVSASLCDRTAADPGGVCNGPVGDGGCSYVSNNGGVGREVGPGCRGLKFQGATPDGSRIFFTTRQQLLDADTDETNDIYACDIPSGTPAPIGDANPCSALRQLSAGDPSGAAVESVGTTSESGSTVLFIAKGVLAANEDAFGEEPVAGDHNLYAWRTDASHPDGQTTFVGRLDSDDLRGGLEQAPQSTPDGRYLVFTTASRLLDTDTDTDTARDLYRYDAEAEELTRASTNVFGVAGNGDFEARISSPAEHNPTTAISDDGQKVVFITTEALSPADGNGEPDVYLWTPGRVSLISTGSVGGGVSSVGESPAVITTSGQDIYFQTPGALTPADGDDAIDVYDARIGGGFSFAPKPICTGEGCQPPLSPPPSDPGSPANRPNGDGNVKSPKPCPKGKVRNKKGKCVKKPKKHSNKKHSGKKASHKRGGGK